MSKLVALSNEAYNLLARRKRGKESFSKVIVREMGKKEKPDIMQFAGMFRKNGIRWDKTEKRLYKERHASKMRDFK